jgi:hypothetical protein
MALRTLQTAPVPRACVVAAEPPVLAPGPLAARMTVDILGAIPVDELELRSRMLRPGRSVELVEAALSAGGREVARAQAWRVLPATAWTRLRHPIVPDEPPSPLQRVLAVADSGNGISGELDLTNWHFINPELTVHLHREAVGEWVCLEAQTAISPGGVGLATSVLSDLDGPIGVGAQTLLVAQR